MSFWRKETGADELIAIADIVLDKTKDYIQYNTYNYPFSHLKYGTKILGFHSNLKMWEKEAKDKKTWRNHYRQSDFEWNEEGKALFREMYMIDKVNSHLQMNLRWKDGQSGKQQFNRGKDIYYYFKKEEAFL